MKLRFQEKEWAKMNQPTLENLVNRLKLVYCIIDI